MNAKTIKQIEKVICQYPEIVLGYLFGSRAEEREGKLSDYDIAIYIKTDTPKLRIKDITLEVSSNLSRQLKTNNIDIVILNQNLPPFLKYNIITKGILVYEKKPYRTQIEPQIFNNYFDFISFMRNRTI